VRRRQRHLLADDRCQVTVEREQELLDLAALRVAAAEADAVLVVEDRRLQEAEDRVDAAVVEEAEAADLIALVAVVAAGQDRELLQSVHAYLLAQLGEVPDFDDLLFVPEARVAVGAEETPARIGHVAPVAVEADVVAGRDAFGAPAAEEEVVAGLLIRRERA